MKSPDTNNISENLPRKYWVIQVVHFTVRNSVMKRQKQRISRYLLVVIWLLTATMFQWGCGQIPEEGTIVYDVEFPPEGSDEIKVEAQVEAQALQHHRTSS